MHIIRLKLHNFRNYKNAEVSFSPQINVFWGNNGQGKTNLLEAIHVVSTGRSFRTHRLQDLILQGQSHFYIEAQFVKDGIVHALKIYYDQTTKKVLFNETAFSQFSSLLGILPCVLLSPDDLALINDSPSERRRFLDLHIAQIDPLYLFYLSRYYKAMKQRNQLLRSQNAETLTVWEQVMAPAASYLMAKRKQAIELLQDPTSQWMKLFAQGEEIALSYHFFLQGSKEEEFQSKLLTHWQNTRYKEMHYGTTLTGPHRDDLSFLLCGKGARHFSSEGQKRSLLASLRFAQWEHMKKWAGAAPLLAIDDFGIQLDAVRQSLLKEQIARFGQVFLTCPHPLTPLASDTDLQAFHIEQGNIKP